jgi:hypothetical protein
MCSANISENLGGISKYHLILEMRKYQASNNKYQTITKPPAADQ